VWSEFKRRKFEGYLEAKERGEVDKDIIPLLDLINSFDCFVTLSSCSGRIAVMDMPEFGDKVESKFLGKWHSRVSFEDILDAIKLGKQTTWLIMFPPIIHVACRDLEAAEKLITIANNSGLRRSGLISFKHNVVEINTLERLEAPVAVNGRIVVGMEGLKVMVEFANKKLERSKEKIKRFYDSLLKLQGSLKP